MKVVTIIITILALLTVILMTVLGIVFRKAAIRGKTLAKFGIFIFVLGLAMGIIRCFDTPVIAKVDQVTVPLFWYVSDGSGPNTPTSGYYLEVNDTDDAYKYCFISQEGEVLKAEADQDSSTIIITDGSGKTPSVCIYQMHMEGRLTKRDAGIGLVTVFFIPDSSMVAYDVDGK